jgi:hypothetical protein
MHCGAEVTESSTNKQHHPPEEARARGTPAGHFKQGIETCEPLDTIFDEIDLLEDDPPHRGVAMRHARFRP